MTGVQTKTISKGIYHYSQKISKTRQIKTKLIESNNNRQRFLPVRQFDTIANFGIHNINNNIYNNSYYQLKGNVIALLPPTTTCRTTTTIKSISLLRLGFGKYIKNIRYYINSKFLKHPLLLGAFVAGTKSIAADLFAQKIIEGRSYDEINWQRNILFGVCMGLFWTGFIHYFLYYKTYPRIFSKFSNKHWFWRASIPALLDQTFHSALFYYPFFYCCKTCIYDGFNIKSCQKGLHTYLYINFWYDIKNLFCVWYPANLITFAIIPPHLRVPWLACVSFAWIVILSLIRGEKQDINNTSITTYNNNNNK